MSKKLIIGDSEPEKHIELRVNFDPALHPRDPDTGQFVERPYDVPDEISDLGTKQVVGELAAANENFAEKVEGLAVDIPGEGDGDSAVPREISELIEDPNAGSGADIQDIEKIDSFDDLSEDDRVRINGKKATITSLVKRELPGDIKDTKKVHFERDVGKDGVVDFNDAVITTVGPSQNDWVHFNEPGGQKLTIDRLLDTKYGVKIGLDTPFEAKDAIKNLDFDKTHRSWDSDLGLWTVDVGSLDAVRDALLDDGFNLRISEDVVSAAEQAN